MMRCLIGSLFISMPYGKKKKPPQRVPERFVDNEVFLEVKPFLDR